MQQAVHWCGRRQGQSSAGRVLRERRQPDGRRPEQLHWFRTVCVAPMQLASVYDLRLVDWGVGGVHEDVRGWHDAARPCVRCVGRWRRVCCNVRAEARAPDPLQHGAL